MHLQLCLLVGSVGVVARQAVDAALEMASAALEEALTSAGRQFELASVACDHAVALIGSLREALRVSPRTQSTMSKLTRRVQHTDPTDTRTLVRIVYACICPT